MSPTSHGPARDHEHLAARYLGGALPAAERERLDAHLLVCPGCWAEVDLARQGRSLAESAREAAPAALRERLRDVVGFAAGPAPRPARRRRVAARALVGGAVVLVGALLLGDALGARLSSGSGQPPVIAATVADVRADRLPGTVTPSLPPPDLSTAALRPAGGAAGRVAGAEVTGYSYRGSDGREIAVYLSGQPFPRADGARDVGDPDGPWTADVGGLTLLCAQVDHDLLLVGDDPRLVREAADALGVL